MQLQQKADAAAQHATAIKANLEIVTAKMEAAQRDLAEAVTVDPPVETDRLRLAAAYKQSKEAQALLQNEYTSAQNAAEAAQAEYARAVQEAEATATTAATDQGSRGNNPSQLCGGASVNITRAMAHMEILVNHSNGLAEKLLGEGAFPKGYLEGKVNWTSGDPCYDRAKQALTEAAACHNNAKTNHLFSLALNHANAIPESTEGRREKVVRTLAKTAAVLKACKSDFTTRYLVSRIDDVFAGKGEWQGSNIWKSVLEALPEADASVPYAAAATNPTGAPNAVAATAAATAAAAATGGGQQ